MEGELFIKLPFREDEIENIIRKAKIKGKNIKKEQVIEAAIIAGAIILTPKPVFAMASITAKIASAFNPIIQIIQGFAIPVFSVIESLGAFTMFFNRQKGLKMMKDGAVAFLVMTFLPELIKLFVSASQAMGNAN